MKKQVKLICAVFVMLSIAILGVSIASVPDATQAVQNDYNVTFNQLSYLPNGYAAQIVGVGTESNGLLYVSASTNVSVGVQKTKKTNSVFKGIKIVHQTVAYGVLGRNGIGRVANFSMTQDCAYKVCTMQKFKSEVAAAVYMETSLYAEISFNDGTYTIYAGKGRKPQ